MLQTELPSWKPRSYQAQGVKIMLSQASAGLLMDPGLGKTSCTYMALKILLEKGYIKRTLVICPLRPAYRVWPHQKDKYAEFADLRVCVLHGKDKDKLLADPNYDIYVVNPEGLDWLMAPAKLPALKKMFDCLVVDESTKFKNPQTKRFKTLKAMIPHFKRRYILTGTPTPKGLMDLFGQVYIMDEGATLGRYITHYRNEFFYPSGFGGYDWKPMPDAAKRIGDKIAPYVLRVAAKGNIELPWKSR
jgi:SNF2 family DNA or RNA helicase